MANISKLRLSGVTYTIVDETAIHDISNYYTTAQTDSQITAATSALAQTIEEAGYQNASQVNAAINDVTNAATNNIHGGISEITILTDKAERIAIYHIDGSKVCDVRTEANTIKHVTVAPGLYIVKGKKVIVR